MTKLRDDISKKFAILRGKDETIGDDSGRIYANSHFSDQNRQDAISRVSAVQNTATFPPIFQQLRKGPL